LKNIFTDSKKSKTRTAHAWPQATFYRFTFGVTDVC